MPAARSLTAIHHCDCCGVNIGEGYMERVPFQWGSRVLCGHCNTHLNLQGFIYVGEHEFWLKVGTDAVQMKLSASDFHNYTLLRAPECLPFLVRHNVPSQAKKQASRKRDIKPSQKTLPVVSTKPAECPDREQFLDVLKKVSTPTASREVSEKERKMLEIVYEGPKAAFFKTLYLWYIDKATRRIRPARGNEKSLTWNEALVAIKGGE